MSIDPVQFGELCGDVKNICKTVDEIKRDLKEHKDNTEKRLDAHGDRITQIETEKKWIYRTFGSGGLGIFVYNLFF